MLLKKIIELAANINEIQKPLLSTLFLFLTYDSHSQET